jgi:hypothetical protein
MALVVTDQQKRKILAINTARWVPEVNVRDPSGSIVGSLTPINTASLDDLPLMESITRWRMENAAAFASQFSPTVDRTRDWLRDTVLPADDRVLFLIRHGDMPIGHIGFRDLTEDAFQGDNLVRGERGGGLFFMRYAIWAFHGWAMQIFDVRRCWARILAHNECAIDFNSSLGTKLHFDLESARANGLVTEGSSMPTVGPTEQSDNRMITGTLCWDDLVIAAPEAVVRDFLSVGSCGVPDL